MIFGPRVQHCCRYVFNMHVVDRLDQSQMSPETLALFQHHCEHSIIVIFPPLSPNHYGDRRCHCSHHYTCSC